MNQQVSLLLVPTEEDAMLVPSNSCKICLHRRTQYMRIWENITEDEIRALRKYDTVCIRVKCTCVVKTQ